MTAKLSREGRAWHVARENGWDREWFADALMKREPNATNLVRLLHSRAWSVGEITSLLHGTHATIRLMLGESVPLEDITGETYPAGTPKGPKVGSQCTFRDPVDGALVSGTIVKTFESEWWGPIVKVRVPVGKRGFEDRWVCECHIEGNQTEAVKL